MTSRSLKIIGNNASIDKTHYDILLVIHCRLQCLYRHSNEIVAHRSLEVIHNVIVL